MFEKVTKFIQELQKSLDLELYLVGGAVRDILQGQEINDYDFTTPILPDDLEEKIIAAGFKPYLIGKKFGTIGLKYDGKYIEITTFRNEIYAGSSRKPKVEFHNDIKYDLERRDLTINAMAISAAGHIIDLFGGEGDLQSKMVKCVGNPDLRFEEDALRMLRAIRFAGVFEFQIEKETFLSIQKNHWRLLNISKERWVMELDKILQTTQIDYALDLLLESGLMSIIIPENSLLDLSIWQDFGLNNFWSGVKNHINQIDEKFISQRWAVLLSSSANLFILSNIINQGKFSLSKTQIFERYTDVINQDYFKKIQAQIALKSGKYLKFSNQRLIDIEDFLLK